jgi:hypothetical protein
MLLRSFNGAVSTEEVVKNPMIWQDTREWQVCSSKAAVAVYLKVLTRQSSRETEENHHKELRLG